MRAVNHGLDAAAACHLADLADGRDLSRDVNHVRDEDDARARRQSRLERRRNLAQVFRRDWNLNGLQYDAFASLALPESRQHARVVLSRRENLVAALKV